MNWQLVSIVLAFATGLVTCVLAYLGWGRRQENNVTGFIGLTIAVTVISWLYCLELITDSTALMAVWFKLRYAFLTLMPVVWLVFALQFTGYERMVTLPRTVALLVIPMMIGAAAMTNDWHNLVWTRLELPTVETALSIQPYYGPLFWINLIYGYCLILAGSGLLLWMALNSRRLYRRQSITLFVSAMFPSAGNLLYILGGDPVPGINPIVLAFTIGCMGLGWGVLRLNVLDMGLVAYDQIIERLPDGVLVLDKSGRITALNAMAAEYLGMRQGGVIGLTIAEALAVIPEALLPVIAGEQEAAALSAGERRLEVRASAMFDRRGLLRGRVLALRDITQQVREQVARRQSEGRYRALFDQAQDAIILEDSQEHIVDVNPAAVRMLGYSRDELLAMGTVDLQVNAQGDIMITDPRFEREIKRKDGTRITVDITQAALEEDDRRLYMSIVRDITGHKTSQAELHRHVEQLSIIQQVVEEISSRLNINFVLSIALDAALRLSGAQAGYIALAQGDDMVLSAALGNYPQEKINAMIQTGQGIIGRVMAQQRPQLVRDVKDDPDYVLVLASTRAMMAIPLAVQDTLVGVLNLETGRPERFSDEVFQFVQILAGHIAVAVDNARLYDHVQTQLAELQTLYAQVSQLEQLKTDMIRIAAHDLRNPLSAIYGYAQLLEMDVEDKQLHYVEEMLTAVKRMNGILQDILSLERIEQMAQSQDTPGHVFNLRGQVARAVEEFRDQAERKEQRLMVDLDDLAEMNVRGDLAQLYEAISNLIGNAIKYTPPGGLIDVCLRKKDGLIIFDVRDNGFGIPEEHHERLFQPFYRAHTQETTGIEGTGLGLHLVKKIIERHRGKMIFRSTYGQGSTFGFSLPAANAAPHQETE